MNTIIGLLFLLLLIAALVKPEATIFNNVSLLKNKSKNTRRLIFFGIWIVLSTVCAFIFRPDENVKTVKETSTKEYAINGDSTEVVLKCQDTLRFDGKGNVEWTSTGMNAGSSMRINIGLAQSVGVYPASIKFDKSNYDGLVYGGYKFYEGEYGAVGLYDFKGDDEFVRIGKANDHESVITKEDYKHLQSAVELDYKSQIKPLSLYSIRSFINSIKVYVQNVNEGDTQDAKRECTISSTDEAFKVILNGIFPKELS